MRLAALFLLVLPAGALAQPTPSREPAAHPAPAKPAPDHKPTTDHKPAPPAHKPDAAKPAHPPAKPPPPKPAPAKPAPPKKPAPPHPAPAAVPAPTPAPAPTEPDKGSNSGLPLPRFASLRSDDVNFRSGPGTRYPIDWVYKRRDLPVEIEREFEVWRLVRDPQGNKGWVHQATLTGRRTAVIAGAEHTLRQAPNDTAGPIAKLKPGVIIRLRSCEANSEWCQAQIGDYRGYIKRSDIWGLEPGEVIQ